MLGQRGIQRHSLGPQSIPLFIFCDNSDGIEGLGPNLDGDLRVRYQIVIPVRVSGCASGGGDHDQAVALGHISQWSRAALAALGPYSREQEQGCVFELPTDFAPICTELLNQAAIVVVHLSYGPSCYRCRPRRQLPYRPVSAILWDQEIYDKSSIPDAETRNVFPALSRESLARVTTALATSSVVTFAPILLI